MKILIIRFSSIGDIVLTTPVARALKVQLENAEIHFCTKMAYASILEENPYIDKVLVLKDSLTDLIGNITNEKYDLIVDLHKNLRTRQIKARSGVPSKSFKKLNWQKWLLTNFKINHLPNIHIVDRYLETVKHLGIKPDNLGLDYFIPEKDIVEPEWLPETHQEEYIAYAIGARHNTKKLPFNRAVELCDKINKPIVLLGDKGDKEFGRRIEEFFARGSDEVEEGLERLNKKTVIYNACGKYNLNQSASILKNAKYVFTHDSGLMHIAAALKKEVFTIWGNTVPLFGMYPYKTKFTIFENNRLSCRPCSKIGYKKCPKGHFKCMNEVTFDFYLP